MRLRFPPLYHVCSQIENSSKQEMKRIKVPYSNLNKQVLTILREEGLIQQVTTGSCVIMIGDLNGPFQIGREIEVKSNVAERRLWVDLKYRQGQRVLTKMQVISKPSRRVFATPQELMQVIGNIMKVMVGREAVSGLVKGSKLGQVTIVETIYGVMEIKDALRKNVGGEVLCYAL